MMRVFVILAVLAGGLWGVQAQEPKGSWQVHKEFDENGNLIRYDSVYSWTSDPAALSFNQEMIDSLFKDIPELLDPVGRDMAEFFHSDPFFSQLFGSDSTFYNNSIQELEDLLRDDPLRIDQRDIDEFMREMERVRQEFLRQMYGQPKTPESEKDSVRH